ncbi:MAG: 50S ribosomal protein L28 [Candidatus Omnitrophica bacterium]|nr:50S ribosomal protein L28 [Candidatus Omnitrophota bacterium]
MLKRCIICNKGPRSGNSLSRRGLAKKKGGTGKKTTRVVKRKFLPNLHKMRIVINKRPQTAYVCTKCLKAGLVQKTI